jgi:hypothetical protein
MTTVICKHCQKPYTVKPSRASKTRYCSMECKAAAQRRTDKNHICQHCKKPYKKQPSLASTTKYCSKKCQGAARRRPEIRCRCCRTLFTPKRNEQVYCTPRCRRKDIGKTRQHRVTKRCLGPGCKEILSVPWSRRHRAHYCSIKCRSEARRIKRKPTADQLRHLVFYMTYEQIGEQYDVCGCTVMNWARAYGVKSPCHKKQQRGPKHPHPSGYIGEAYGA